MASPRARAVTVDLYSHLSHKALVGEPDTDPTVGAPTWCPRSERRRIRAYLARGAYLGGNARNLLPADATDKAVASHREYGDPAWIVDRFVAAVLGDDPTWIVEGADDELPDEPDLPPEPEEPAADASDIQRRIHASRTARWAAEAEAMVDAWEEAWAAQPALRQRQTEFRAWVERATIDQVVHETEHDTAGLADSIMVLWHQANDWPRPEILPPEANFPVRDEHDDGAFPRKVHLAWEYLLPVLRDGRWTDERYLRRVTFELAEIADTRSDGGVWLDLDSNPDTMPGLRPDEATEVDEDGFLHVTRAYPWDRDDGATSLTETAADRLPSRDVCLYSDGSWKIEDLGDDVWVLDESKANWRPYGDGIAYKADYGIDFLPVIHTPNTPTGKEHYGLSVIEIVYQLLDDLAGADTATAGASRYLGHPTVALENAELPTGPDGKPIPLRLAPGMVHSGKLTPLDMSAGLEKLMAYDDHLLTRVSQNTTLPADLLGGRDETGGPESGFSRLIRWAPFGQTIGTLRMVRKWPLFGKMSQRMAQVQGRWDGPTWVPVLPPGPTPVVRLEWGSFLPTDKAETLKMVGEALTAHAISLQTGVALLVAAGFPIEDARAEIVRIRADDTESADTMADALAGHPDLLAIVADRLSVAAPVEAPVVPLDPLVTE